MIFLYLSSSFVLSAQNFTELVQFPLIDGVERGDIAFADVDGDNDLDLFISGQSGGSSLMPMAQLYLNDGSGNYAEDTANSFLGVYESAIAFADIDNDNDPDLLVTGRSDSLNYISTLYLNDGDGRFTASSMQAFENVSYSALAFADVDNDNDQDVLITGWNGTKEVSKLYTNDGNGAFTELLGTPFQDVQSGALAFADIDNDNDLDVLITGQSGSFRTARLYTNDGDALFTEVTGTPFDSVRNGAVAFADIDNDNDLDLLISGEVGALVFPPLPLQTTKLYLNDGLGSFSELSGTPFDAVDYSAVAFADINQDMNVDVLITGRNGTAPSTKLYLNQGAGSFSELSNTPFENINNSSVAMVDLNGDSIVDVFLSGFLGFPGSPPISKLYLNALTSANEGLELHRPLEFSLFPNPTSRGQLQLRISSARREEIVIKIFDLQGRSLHATKETLSPDVQEFNIDISFLASGRYLMHLDNGKQSSIAIFQIY